MSGNPAFGGQGLPESLELAVNELLNEGFMARRACGGLTLGAIHAIEAHAVDALKQLYLPSWSRRAGQAPCATLMEIAEDAFVF